MFQISILFFFGCNTNNPHSSSPISSYPIQKESHISSTSNETKVGEKGTTEKIEEIRIEFDSSIPSYSIQDLGLDKELLDVVESSLNLMESNCVSDSKIAELIQKDGYGKLCIQDRFIVYITIEESRSEISQISTSSSDLIEHLVPVIIDRVHHPISSIRTDYLWSKSNTIKLYLPKKVRGRKKYIETAKALTTDLEIQIQDLNCQIIDITCNQNIGIWEINGFQFEGLRSKKQLQSIIELHRRYHTPFKEYNEKYYKSR